MKVPRFEAQADRWGDDARFAFVFSKEAHAKGQGGDELNAELDRLLASDKDGNGIVTQAEYGGSPSFFGSCDVNGDGEVASHEAVSIRRIDEFDEVATPTTLQQRRALARRLRDEVPGTIPVLLDTPDDATANAYKGWPNAAFVIDGSCNVAAKLKWANEAGVERELARLTGRDPQEPSRVEINWAPIDSALRDANARNVPLLLHLTAKGCGACERQEAELLRPKVNAAMQKFTVARRDITDDATWTLFEGLDLQATPAFVLIDPGARTPLRMIQGFRPAEELVAFLAIDL
ncbi:MAG: thioredoxin family protein [Myxococcota bacterium]